VTPKLAIAAFAIPVTVAVAASAATALAHPSKPSPHSFNSARAQQNWILSCQGCHRPDATGTPNTTPTMAGHVGRFLHVEGGREYLARVPGVATAALSDEALAELLNWMLVRFDPAHMPNNFTPYTADEVGRLRIQPLRTGTAARRTALISTFPRESAE
jgi:cytochrome c553